MENKAVWSACRWSQYAKLILDDDDVTILLDASVSDYQGSVLVFYRDDTSWRPSYGILSYSYGSCCGCDSWEGQPTVKILRGMVDSVLLLDDAEMLRKHVENLKATNPTWAAHADDPDWYDTTPRLIAAIETELQRLEKENN